MNHHRLQTRRSQHEPEVRDHPRIGFQRIERRLLVERAMLTDAVQPAPAGVDESHRARARTQVRQQAPEQPPIDLRLVVRKGAGGVNDGLDGGQRMQPARGRAQIAGNRLSSQARQPVCRDTRARQCPDLVARPDQCAHHGLADRAGATQDQDSHRCSRACAAPRWLRAGCADVVPRNRRALIVPLALVGLGNISSRVHARLAEGLPRADLRLSCPGVCVKF